MEKAFELSDNITGNAVKGIADTIMLPSLINLDFADLRTIVKDTGTAVISIGTGSGADRVQQAIKSTRSHPLLTVDYDRREGSDGPRVRRRRPDDRGGYPDRSGSH